MTECTFKEKEVPAFLELTLEECTQRHVELLGIIQNRVYECPSPQRGPLIDRIEKVFELSRGPEIEMVSSLPLPFFCHHGSKPCLVLTNALSLEGPCQPPSLRNSPRIGSLSVLSHTSKAVAMVQDYVSCLLGALCGETRIKTQLWNTLCSRSDMCRIPPGYESCQLTSSCRKGRATNYFQSIFQRGLAKEEGRTS